ncbi:uncharacterized protein IWZ02DRAFT_219581 [Phyllosticta citriasiana]|uniref:Uncharacterized protein n=1 Tax=Phyllosticta citriasiana TaxID=595635 RepID=A0ABR1KNG9_9PEZI
MCEPSSRNSFRPLLATTTTTTTTTTDNNQQMLNNDQAETAAPPPAYTEAISDQPPRYEAEVWDPVPDSDSDINSNEADAGNNDEPIVSWLEHRFTVSSDSGNTSDGPDSDSDSDSENGDDSGRENESVITETWQQQCRALRAECDEAKERFMAAAVARQDLQRQQIEALRQRRELLQLLLRQVENRSAAAASDAAAPASGGMSPWKKSVLYLVAGYFVSVVVVRFFLRVK